MNIAQLPSVHVFQDQRKPDPGASREKSITQVYELLSLEAIQEASMDGAEMLNLAHKHLTTLPSEIGELPALRVLQLYL
jgi:hypothetical protein